MRKKNGKKELAKMVADNNHAINRAIGKAANHIIIYTSEDGQTKIDVELKDETVWLSQKQMAELFDVVIPTVNEHLKNIFETGELEEDSVIRNFRTTATDGKIYDTKHYNLDAIIALGYRVNSMRATRFRIWATQRLKEYIIKGFTMDDERLAKGATTKGTITKSTKAEGMVHRTYFDEWEERIRKIRTSEANFYQKVRDVFATSADYDPKLDYAKQFFATVQNKFHFAITGLTAAELVVGRIDSKKASMGLTNWKSKWKGDWKGGVVTVITREQAEIAKNYLEELELKRLNLLVEQFLSFAELQSVERRVMYMKDWIGKLDGFLTLNDKEILVGHGAISRRDMEQKVRRELERFNRKRLG